MHDGQDLGSSYRPEELVYFKEDPRWAQQVQELKRVLASREHVPKGPELRTRRVAKAIANRSKSRGRPKKRTRR